MFTQEYRIQFASYHESDEVVKELCNYAYSDFVYNRFAKLITTESFSTAMLVLDICLNDCYMIKADVQGFFKAAE